ncbi:MAG: leucine-rich repeat protein [Firmicutes bacterium]|nr:leucine-rich repeat protein [Bacillota bacterium]
MKKINSLTKRKKIAKYFVCAFIAISMMMGMLVAFSACGGMQHLITPTDLEFDGPANVLSWSEVPYSTGGYQIRIIGGGEITTIDLDEYESYVYMCRICGWIYDGPLRDPATGESLVPHTCEHCVENCDSDLDNYLDCQICNPEESHFVRTQRRGTPNWVELPLLGSGTFHLSVRAITIDHRFFRDSEWSSPLEIYLARTSGMTYRRINNGTEYELTSIGTAGNNITVASYHNGLPVTSIGDSAFRSINRLNRIVLGSNIRRIGSHAFANAMLLEEVLLPHGLEFIGNNAFQANVSLSSIDIPNTVTHIGQHAFNGSGLVEVRLPPNLTSISSQLFSNALMLERVSGGARVETIGTLAFSGTVNLNHIELSSSLRNIERLAFQNSGITKIEIPHGINRIGRDAFTNARELNSISIPNSVTSIGIGAFRNTAIWNNSDTEYGLIYVDGWVVGGHDNTIEFATVSAGTRGIAETAFRTFTSLSDISLPDSLMHINSGAFGSTATADAASNTALWTSQAANLANHFIYADDWLIASTNSARLDITLRRGIVGIADGALRGHSHLTNIVYEGQGAGFNDPAIIPEGVRSIGDFAFSGAFIDSNRNEIFIGVTNSLRNYQRFMTINLPSTLRHIGESAFDSTSVRRAEVHELTEQTRIVYAGLIDFSIPENLESVGRFAFARMRSMTEITIPDTLTEIPEGIFFANRDLETVYIHDGITSIGAEAFSTTTGLKNFGVPENGIVEGVVIPNTVTHIGRRAFLGSGIEGVVLPNNITVIEDEVFRYSNIRYVDIFEGVTSIGYAAFMATDINTITLPSTLRIIGDRVFFHAIHLHTIHVPEGVTRIGDRVFQGSFRLHNVTLPSTLRTIGDFAFAQTQNMSSIVIPEGVTHIGRYSFFGNHQLQHISLPSTLLGIGEYAFANSNRLPSVTLGPNVQGIGPHAFWGTSNLTIYSSRSWRGDYWSVHWNSSLRPVVWDSIISENGNYVTGVRITYRMLSDGTLMRRIANLDVNREDQGRNEPVRARDPETGEYIRDPETGDYVFVMEYNPETGEYEVVLEWVSDINYGLSAPIRQGSIFLGWWAIEGISFDNLIEANGKPGIEVDGVILEARWSDFRHNEFVFDANGGTFAWGLDDPIMTINAYQIFWSPTFNIMAPAGSTGWTFLGWYDNPNFEGERIVFDADNPIYCNDGTRTRFYARWAN